MKKISFIIALIASMFVGNAMAQTLTAGDVKFAKDSNPTAATLDINISADKLPAGIEFNVLLPEGFDFKKTSKGKITEKTLIAERGEALEILDPEDDEAEPRFTLSIDEIDGGVNITIVDYDGGMFESKEGKLLTLNLTCAADKAIGTYDGTIQLVMVSDYDGTIAENETSNFKLIVAETDADIYTVAGAFKVGEEEQASFFGEMWAPALSANDMTWDEVLGVYILEFKEVALTPGTILYKVVKNHSWDVNWGFDGNNADYIVNNEGTYNITFKFNPDNAINFNFNVDCVLDQTVGIRDITIDGENGNVYNTAGQRVSRTTKGLFIQNGKKVVKK